MPALFASGRVFAAIVERADPGSVIPYHIGCLAVDETTDEVARDVSKMARSLSIGSLPICADSDSMQYGMGVGTLAQRRLSAGMYQYLFIKSKRAV